MIGLEALPHQIRPPVPPESYGKRPVDGSRYNFCIRSEPDVLAEVERYIDFGKNLAIELHVGVPMPDRVTEYPRVRLCRDFPASKCGFWDTI
jgi:hypothetical protein